MKFGIFEQLNFEIKSLKENYPEFVLSNSVKNIFNELPVFVFHTVKPLEFENQLKYIKENGYNTLSVNEFYNAITTRSKKEKSILLTFDDGRSSFWRIAFPLLKRYNLKATLFIIPGITSNRKPTKNLDDVWQKKASVEEIVNMDKDDKDYCSWEELKIMYNSNLIDIESHSLMHRVVFTSNKIIDFIDNTTHDSVLTAYRSIKEIDKAFQREKYFGYPVFPHEPLLKGNVNIKVNKNLIEFCRNYYLEHKNNSSWKTDLKNILSEKKFGNSKINLPEEVKNEIENDFKISSGIIKDKIGKSAGDHLCLPWTVGSDIAIDAAKISNYKSVFWGATKKKTNRPGDDPFYICRIKNDFIFRLPGKRRKNLSTIYLKKFLRRVKSEAVY